MRKCIHTIDIENVEPGSAGACLRSLSHLVSGDVCDCVASKHTELTCLLAQSLPPLQIFESTVKRLVDVAVASRTFTGERRISRWEMNNQQAHRAIIAGKVEPANSKVAFVQVSPVCVVWVLSVIICDEDGL